MLLPVSIIIIYLDVKLFIFGPREQASPEFLFYRSTILFDHFTLADGKLATRDHKAKSTVLQQSLAHFLNI